MKKFHSLPFSRFSLVFALSLSPFLFTIGPFNTSQTALDIAPNPGIQGPLVVQGSAPYEFNGDLRDLPKTDESDSPNPPPYFKHTPVTEPKGASPEIVNWVDPVAQINMGNGQMPPPIMNFPGMSYTLGGSGWPPDTNGDVGPDHYIQTVNTSIAIYNKNTGNEIVRRTFNQFFTGTNTPCDNQNYGDPVVVYDRFVDRWVITDFATPGPYYECIAISKSSDPVSGGWYMYGVKISDHSFNDYP